MIACEKCDALNPKNAATCVECDAPLTAAAPPLPGDAKQPEVAQRRPLSRRQRREADPEAVERSRQRQEFGRIKSIVFTVRSVYLAGAAFAVVQLLLYHFRLAPLFAELELDTISLIVGAVSWTQFALLLAGSRFIKRAPFPWTLIGASYWTIGTGQAIWISTLADGALLEDSRVLAFLTMMVLMTFAFWFAVAQARRVANLMAANPELQLERKRIAPEERSLGGVAEEAKMRSRGDRQRGNMANLRIILIGSAILVLGGGGVWAMTRPASVDDSVDRFARVWSQNDPIALSKLLVDGEHSRSGRQLREDLTQRGWHEKMPELAAA